MNKENYTGGKLRMEAYKKLKVFLANPGKFCLLVAGPRGSGKQHAIKMAYSELIQDEQVKNYKKDLILEADDPVFIDAITIPAIKEQAEEWLNDHKDKTVVITNVDELITEQQKILFTILSTENGKFGLDKKEYNIRFVFTSNKKIGNLRVESDSWSGQFWDRISQLIVEFPSFTEEKSELTNYFIKTWKKMKFDESATHGYLATVPKEEFITKLLRAAHDSLFGGFRDLDKLVIQYFNYRILFYGDDRNIDPVIEAKVVKSVRESFFEQTQRLDNKNDDLNTFSFEPGLTDQELKIKYRIALRKWAEMQYGSVKDAAKALDISPRALSNYLEKSDRETSESGESS